MARLFRYQLSGYVLELSAISLIVGMGLMTVWETRERRGPLIGVVTHRVEIGTGKGGHVDGVRVAITGGETVVARGDKPPGQFVCLVINRGEMTNFKTAELLAEMDCLRPQPH